MTGAVGADPSYRALLDVPWLPRILVSMILSRVAQSMVGIAIVLFTLQEYDSPTLAGIVTLASILPGLVVAPIAGALLDRHGRMRLVTLDYLVAMAAMALIAVLSLAGALPPWLLVLIAAVSSLTSILSVTGIRSLFPIIVPEPLWERANAIDSNGYVVATIVGPPLAAGLVAVVGGEAALLVTAVGFGAAAIALLGVPDPETNVVTSGRILRDALDGVRYAWNNRTIRGLAFSISTLNLAGGISTIVVPLLVIEQLGYSEALVGVVFALSGLAGMGSALVFGRMDTRGKEWRLLVLPMIGIAPFVALLLVPAVAQNLDPMIGLLFVAAWSIGGGLLNGPIDIALFTIRQRRTDPSWTGRAFAVSMAMNFVGFPIGAALAGVLAEQSLATAIVPSIVFCVLGVVFAATMIPREDPADATAPSAAASSPTEP
ncbi:MAG TPA: MFS transporter [Candidatus Limnocylindrales bacterium]|nr:MFS transporter [Candidatus Limnocylindrales bacterium]